MSVSEQATQPGGLELNAEPAAAPSPDRTVACPFRVVVDTREQRPYGFKTLRANADQGHALITVPIVRRALDVGDYCIDGIEWCIVERKSKEDLYSSVARRENFDGRLARMCASCSVASVVVECEWQSMLLAPPRHSHLNPRALARTILSWSIRYPNVHWWFLPDRDSAESFTFRFLERYWHLWKSGHTATQEEFRAHMARPGGPPYGSLDEVQP